MEKLEFKEKQQFRQLDVLLLLSFLMIGLIYRCIQVGFAGLRTDFSGYLLFIILIGAALIYFYNLRLITVVNKKGVRFQYYPWHYKKHKIDWDEIERVDLVKTPLNTALTGWNIRFSDEKYYSVCGNSGMEIKLKSGEKVFIGSKNTDRLKSSLEAMGKLQPPDQIPEPGNQR